MLKISILIAAVAGLMSLPGSVSAEDKKMLEEEIRGPKEAKTTAEIVKAVENIHLGMAIGGKPDEIRTAEFRRGNHKIFVAWHSPSSGVKSCRVYLYLKQANHIAWSRQLFKVFDETNEVSVEFGEKVTFRDERGNVVHAFDVPVSTLKPETIKN